MSCVTRTSIKINTHTVGVCVLNDIITMTLVWLFSDCIGSEIAVVVMKGVALLVVLLWGCEAAVVTRHEAQVINERPIIGVLSQEQSFYLHGKFPEENYTSYIAASYVKDIESSGARVVPIMIGRDRAYYEDIMSKINGIMIPGGATYFNQSMGYADAAEHILDISRELYESGHPFPLFGTCLGFELLLILDSSGRDLNENRITCRSFENLPLEFTDDYRRSRMFASLPRDLHHILSTEDVTVNQHQFCITDDNLEKYNMTDNWRVMSYNHDELGVQFVSSVEHKRYPIYAVQFHPEKNAFEWKLSKNYPHSKNAIRANRYFMDYFVDQCRKNNNKFKNAAEENKYLIYNHEATFTGAIGSAYEQCYLFEPKGDVAGKLNQEHSFNEDIDEHIKDELFE